MAKGEKKVKEPKPKKEKKPAKKLWGLPIWAWVVIVVLLLTVTVGRSESNKKKEEEAAAAAQAQAEIEELTTIKDQIVSDHAHVMEVIDSTTMTDDQKSAELETYIRDDDGNLYSYIYDYYPELEKYKDIEDYADLYGDLEMMWLYGVQGNATAAQVVYGGHSDTIDTSGNETIYNKYLTRANEELENLK